MACIYIFIHDVVVFHKVDRNARDECDYYFHRAQLKKRGVRYEYAAQNIDDSPEGQMMEGLLVSMAAYYSRNLAKEVIKGMKENAYQCLHTGGKPPLGYDVGPDKKYVINEREAAAVRLIFSMRATGENYKVILDALNERGYKTKTGHTFGKNSLNEILRNRKYVGIYTFGRVAGGRHTRKSSHVDSDAMIQIPGGIPAIVPQEIWDTVHNRIATQKRTGRSTATEEYLLSGYAFCGLCSSRLSGGRVNQYAYYRCGTQYRKCGGCKLPRIKKQELEDKTISALRKLYLTKTAIIEIQKEMEAKALELASSHAKESKSIEAQIADYEKRQSRLLDMIEMGAGMDEIKERMQENRQKIAVLNMRLNEITAASNQMLLSSEGIKQVLQSYSNDDSMEARRAIIRSFLDRVIVHPDKIEIEGLHTFDSKPNKFSVKMVEASLFGSYVRTHSLSLGTRSASTANPESLPLPINPLTISYNYCT